MSVTHNPPAGLVGETEWLDEHVVSLSAADVGAEPSGTVATHAAAADPHTGYLKENDANWVDLTDGGATTLHTHSGGAGVTLNEVIDALYPVGALYVSTVSTNPGTLLGRGTWAAFGAGRVMVGQDGGDADFDTAEETGGAKTKAISAHANTAVAQHAAQSHSAHAGATVGNHTFTQPSGHSNHTVTQPSAHTDVLNHVHTENINTATTGGVVGFPALADTSTSGSQATGLTTSNPTANGVASQAHTGTAVDAHSAHSGGAVDAHTVGQASAHSDHAALTHSVTQPDAHTDLNVIQPYIVVHMWKRTA